MLFSRIKKSGLFKYDPATDKFAPFCESVIDDSVFLDLDTLCQSKQIKPISNNPDTTSGFRSSAMEKLVHELLSDRLLLLSHYITMDTANRTILIDQTSLKADGYRVMLH